MERVSELQIAVGPMLLGRDRAFRRFWILESLPGVYVEHDDDFIGSCLPEPTPYNPSAGPLDEESALKKVSISLKQHDRVNVGLFSSKLFHWFYQTFFN